MYNKKSNFLKCKSCGYEWIQEKMNSHTIYYCPRCGMIGHLHEQFNLMELENSLIHESK